MSKLDIENLATVIVISTLLGMLVASVSNVWAGSAVSAFMGATGMYEVVKKYRSRT